MMRTKTKTSTTTSAAATATTCASQFENPNIPKPKNDTGTVDLLCKGDHQNMQEDTHSYPNRLGLADTDCFPFASVLNAQYISFHVHTNNLWLFRNLCMRTVDNEIQSKCIECILCEIDSFPLLLLLSLSAILQNKKKTTILTAMLCW